MLICVFAERINPIVASLGTTATATATATVTAAKTTVTSTVSGVGGLGAAPVEVDGRISVQHRFLAPGISYVECGPGGGVHEDGEIHSSVPESGSLVEGVAQEASSALLKMRK